MASNATIPKGTRDFLPEQSLKRQFIFDTARKTFQLFGYQPIETPAMENLDTLLGKYGEEGDKLIYKILNNGDFLDQIWVTKEELGWWNKNVSHNNPDTDFHIGDLMSMYTNEEVTLESAIRKRNNQIANAITSKALRYDLTVPFARFVVQHQNELSFPFKRYQIQPVWRADRPQKGRYREFFQCDVDVIGSDSLLNESELLCIVDEVFSKLGLNDIVIRLNNRKILMGIAEASGLSGYFGDLTVAIDKIDKIGLDGVREEMIKRGLPEQGVKKALNLIKLKGKPDETLSMLANALVGVTEAQRGIEEVKSVLRMLPPAVKAKVQIDLTLARGLNYYTGAIIEVGHPQFSSSICGGGRYDDLTGIFGLKGMSGVGVSFGADRIFDLMQELNLFPDALQSSGLVLFTNFGEVESRQSLKLATELRSAGISTELYPDAAKMQKQMKYADAKGFKYVVIIGSEEMKASTANLKNMQSGEQQQISQNELTKFISANLR